MNNVIYGTIKSIDVYSHNVDNKPLGKVVVERSAGIYPSSYSYTLLLLTHAELKDACRALLDGLTVTFKELYSDGNEVRSYQDFAVVDKL